MNNKILIAGGGVLLVLVLAGSIVYGMMKNNSVPEGTININPSPVTQTSFKVTSFPSPTAIPTISPPVMALEIDFTDTGFTPKTVTIKAGTPVKFVNKSSKTMWVASAPHPTHTDYPEFDQKSTGDEYTFVFEKVGSWKYHNHTPFMGGGVITVTP